MAPTFTEGRHSGEGLLSEAPGQRSREGIVIASGAGIIAPGSVLGQILTGGATSAAKAGGNTGNGTLVPNASTPVLAGAKPGVYTLRFTTATVFSLLDPNGDGLGSYSIGGATGNNVTVSNEIMFALTQGATVFAVGDGFDITVAAGSGKYVLSPHTANNGSQIAAAIAIYGCDATSADQRIAALVRDAEWNANTLTYEATVNDATRRAAKAAQLAAQGIIVRA